MVLRQQPKSISSKGDGYYLLVSVLKNYMMCTQIYVKQSNMD